jgi:solute:Na+ symporter, SSS family
MSYQSGAISAGVIFIVYTLFGGQYSIIKTDTFQSVLIITGIIIISVFIVIKSPVILPERNHIQHLFNSAFSPFDLLILILTYSVTFVVGPDIYSRIFCAKNEKTASKSVFIVALVLIPLSFLITYIGIYSSQAETSGIIDFASHLLPGWMYGLFLAALLSAVMSSADTTLLNSSIILGELVSGNLNKFSSLKLTRLFVVILGILSIVIALFVTSIIEALLFALTLFSGAFTIPMLFGLLNIRTKKHNLIAAIITGGFTALVGKITNTYFNETIGNFIIISSFAISTILLLQLKKSPEKNLNL